jgi:phosphoglycolate phosphatase
MLRIADHLVSPRLVILDKDGTLVAFAAMWHTWFARLMDGVAQRVPFSLEFRVGLAATLGYEVDDGAWDPEGPLTIGSTGEVTLLLASQVYRYLGKTWTEALDIVQEAYEATDELLADGALAEPIGDVRAVLRRIKAAGIMIAVATTDRRGPTEATFKRLGIEGLIDATACGNDGIPLKPAPDMALEVCRRLNVAPGEAIMIGDTVADLEMARRAGLGLAVGVTCGANRAETLAPLADALIRDLEAIVVVPQPVAERR